MDAEARRCLQRHLSRDRELSSNSYGYGLTIKGKPPAEPGDSQSLIVPGIGRRNSLWRTAQTITAVRFRGDTG